MKKYEKSFNDLQVGETVEVERPDGSFVTGKVIKIDRLDRSFLIDKSIFDYYYDRVTVVENDPRNENGGFDEK